MISGLVLTGFDQVYDFTSPVYAQRSSSCDRFVISPSDCSLNSFSPLPHDSSAANEDDNKDKKSGDIGSEIPSTVGSGVPFP
jgi:hypothetical protein